MQAKLCVVSSYQTCLSLIPGVARVSEPSIG